ncbi:MAG: STAS/SEC14 domain-containing protein [Longimicrobiales bacterium]
MPIESRFDSDRNLLITVAEGRLTADDVRTHQRTLASAPDFHPSADHLFDLSRVTHFDVDPDRIRDLASVSIFSETSRRAVVAPRDVLFGLSRMYSGYRDVAAENLRVFRTLKEALAWLQDTEPREP